MSEAAVMVPRWKICRCKKGGMRANWRPAKPFERFANQYAEAGLTEQAEGPPIDYAAL